MIYAEDVETHRFEYGKAAKLKAQQIAIALQDIGIDLYDVYGDRISFLVGRNQVDYVRAPDKKWAICVTNQFHISPSGYQEIGSIRPIDPEGPWTELKLEPQANDDKPSALVRILPFLAVIATIYILIKVFSD